MELMPTQPVHTSGWVKKARRPRRLLVGMRFSTVENSRSIPIRTGMGSPCGTLVAEPTRDHEHVSGPVYWLTPHGDDFGYAECATCGETSKTYTESHMRHAQRWAHAHRCKGEGRP